MTDYSNETTLRLLNNIAELSREIHRLEAIRKEMYEEVKKRYKKEDKNENKHIANKR